MMADEEKYPYVIEIDNDWYFHPDSNNPDDEIYYGHSYDQDEIIKKIIKDYPDVKFRVSTMYGGPLIDAKEYKSKK